MSRISAPKDQQLVLHIHRFSRIRRKRGASRRSRSAEKYEPRYNCSGSRIHISVSNFRRLSARTPDPKIPRAAGRNKVETARRKVTRARQLARKIHRHGAARASEVSVPDHRHQRHTECQAEMPSGNCDVINRVSRLPTSQHWARIVRIEYMPQQRAPAIPRTVTAKLAHGDQLTCRGRVGRTTVPLRGLHSTREGDDVDAHGNALMMVRRPCRRMAEADVLIPPHRSL